MERQLQRNIQTIYSMAFFQAFMIIVAVFVPLMQRHGLTMSEVLQTQALFALVIAVCEVPSGYMADIWGRIQTIRIGQGLYALSFIWLVQADSFFDFLVYELIIGIGISLSSGADLALLYDTQTALNESDNTSTLSPGKHIARMVAIEGYAGGGAAVAASLLTYISLDWVLWVQAFAGLLAFILSMALIEAPRDVTGKNHLQNIGRVYQDIVGRPVVLWTTMAIILFGLIGLLAFWSFQKYWEVIGIPVEWFGFLYALSCLTRGLSAQYAHSIERSFGWKSVFILSAILPVIGFLGMGMSGGFIGLLFGLCFPFARGVSLVIFYDALNKRVAADFRATINSLASLGMRAVFIFTGPILGVLIDQYGVKTSLLISGLTFAPIIIVVLGYLAGVISTEDRIQKHFPDQISKESPGKGVSN